MITPPTNGTSEIPLSVGAGTAGDGTGSSVMSAVASGDTGTSGGAVSSGAGSTAEDGNGSAGTGGAVCSGSGVTVTEGGRGSAPLSELSEAGTTG